MSKKFKCANRIVNWNDMILTYISIETLIYLFKSHGFAKRIAMHYDKKLFIKGVSENPHSLDTFV